MFSQKLTDWELCGYDPYVPFYGKCMELGKELAGVTPVLKVKVPGSIYRYLQAAKLIPDPFYERNSLLCEWVPNRWWVYKTRVRIPEGLRGRLRLTFQGIDYRAHVYVGARKVAEHIGMFVPCTVDITDYVLPGSEETIGVVIESAPAEFGQIGLTSKTSTQKARFSYDWDFCFRMVQLGLYGGVILEEVPDVTAESFYFRADSAGSGSLQVELKGRRNREYALSFSLCYKGKRVLAGSHEGRLRSKAETIFFPFRVEDPKAWNPLGHGEQNLYKLRIALESGGVIQKLSRKVGFREIRLEKNEQSPPGSLPYTFCVNGKKIYAKGFDLVPLDMNYGALTAGRYRRLVEDLAACNVNFVRVWGGGLIESETFYELCDRYGILVWQDFIQSSSGIDNYPAQSPAYLALLKRTAEWAVKTRRNHPCLAAFCGGNELYYPDFRPVGFENKNLKMLRGVVQEHCDTAMFPASPSGKSACADFDRPDDCHDVHGPWQYFGDTDGADYYGYYNRKRSLFHSEFGCDGLSDLRTLQKILSPRNQGVFDNRNLVWRHRGEWWNTLQRDAAVFGDNIRTLADYVAASQFIQAEALRYAVEANRRAAFVNSGSFIWQFNEPVPNTSCTSAVDYYGRKKAAYYAVKAAYGTVNPNLRYEKLIYSPGERAEFSLFVSSDLPERAFGCGCRVSAGDKVIFETETRAVCGEGKSAFAGSFQIEIPPADAMLFRLWAKTEDGEKYENSALLLIRRREQKYVALGPVYRYVAFLKGEDGME